YTPFAADGERAPSPPTPLAPAPRFGPGVWLKHEACSLTGSHKDRFHAVTARVARRLGSRGIVASSTGNHGVAAAAHAAAAGLPAVVFCHPAAPAGLLRAIGAFGGIAAQLDPAAQREALVGLVEAGWFPATTMDPVLAGAANPFGAEGYKAIAYEIVEQLGAMPESVFIPTAGGDTYYGMLKGFAEVAALSGGSMPVVFAIQPEGANALTRSLAAGRQETVEHPVSIALSLTDQRTGRQAMAAAARWGGRALDVAETAIRAAIGDLAGMGIYPDPASAAALAGYRHAVASGMLGGRATAVLLLTSSGFKWPEAMAEVFPAAAVRGADELRSRLSDLTAVAAGPGQR
ncbi:MAG: pyridoxal-phosphate dependent enzyme, partial [Chloroflexia bacterium]|nr:pyridoxal-phosphate dependent enzyme [Chloroflexia bacterium]